MNWDAIGAIGEILGAFAVFGSLVYLAIQIRSQNLESKAAAVHDISEGYRTLVAEMIKPPLAKVWVKSLTGFEQLDDEEKMQIVAFGLLMFRVLEEGYYQYKAGRLNSYVWDGMVAGTADILSTDSIDNVWKSRKHQFSPDFQKFIDSLEPGTYSVAFNEL